jgi:nucleotide-binding universal stress UspA family protein
MNNSQLIVVGVDGSDGGQRALDWAAREVTTRGGAVRAVLAWRWDGIESGPTSPTNPADERARAIELLNRELEKLVKRQGSSVPVTGDVLEGRPADVLTAAATTADLLVLGSHGHTRLRHTVLGSVSEECIRKGMCPVVVIPVPAPAPEVPAQPARQA